VILLECDGVKEFQTRGFLGRGQRLPFIFGPSLFHGHLSQSISNLTIYIAVRTELEFLLGIKNGMS